METMPHDFVVAVGAKVHEEWTRRDPAWWSAARPPYRPGDYAAAIATVRAEAEQRVSRMMN
jgi:hypothetical protein